MATRSWNRVELIGNITKDPELRYTPQGTAVATFSIATNRTFITDGEKREEVDFHRCVAWTKLAELCAQLLKKGNRVFVSGRLQNRSWEGQDGVQKNITEIVIEDMLLLTSKPGEAAHTENISEDVTPAKAEVKTEAPTPEPEVETQKPADKKATEEVGDLDDLPF